MPDYIEPQLSRRGNEISALGTLGHELFHMLAGEISAFARDGADCIRLNLTALSGAFPEGAVPLMAFVSQKRSQGIRFEVNLPSSASLRNLFLNTNWAHFIDPDRYNFLPAPFTHHLSVQNFADLREQDRVVSMLLEVDGQVEERLREDVTLGEHQRDQQPSEPAVAVEERVYDLELIVNQRELDQQRH